MKDRTELIEICKVYSSASKLIMDINDIITESKDIDDKYKELDDNEYNKVIGCICELFKYAVVTAKILNCIYDNYKEE